MDPWGRLTNLEGDMDKLFNWALGRGRGEGDVEGVAWAPALDVRETDDSFVVEADVPGMEKDGIEITVLDNVLTIKGERKRAEEIKEESYRRVERIHGTFQRGLSFPTSVDAGKVKASFKNGVLQVTLPKHEKAKPKQISVDIDG
jgi:HSP20 family protein